MSQNGEAQHYREEVLKLIKDKEELEREIQQLQEILTLNGVGMEDPLVDAEGYPLPNVDVYQVRHARHLLCCKQNDYKEIMKSIESGIAGYYENTTNVPSTVREEVNLEPFARIHIVQPGSPADSAGLRDGDLLIEFGSVNKSNFRGVQDIGTVVKHSIGGQVKVKVQRSNQFFNLNIKPRKWDGQGLLGCNVVPH